MDEQLDDWSTFSNVWNRNADPLTGFSVVASEVGVSLALAVEGYEGFTNLVLGDGSDTQPVEWFAVDSSGDPAEVTSITVTVTEDGQRRSLVQATPDGLILEQIQPLALTYELVSPGEAGRSRAGARPNRW